MDNTPLRNELEKLRQNYPLLLAKVYLDHPEGVAELINYLGRDGHDIDEWVAAIKRLPKDRVFITTGMDKLDPLDPGDRFKLCTRRVSAWAIEQYLKELFSNGQYESIR